MQNKKIEWIAFDWGISRLRTYAMQGATLLDLADSSQDMESLRPDEFEPVLNRLIAPWVMQDRVIAIVGCGMAGAREGWQEVPYVPVPAKPPVSTPMRLSSKTTNQNVWIVPGLMQERPADVMRGEETQVAGFLALNPGWDGVLCLPGTHTKWVHVSAGEVVSFQSVLTGELFALLSTQSSLRHSLEGSGWDSTAFENGLELARSRPERLTSVLFSLRANDILNDQPTDTARAYLSGLLIGAELAATRAYWLGQQIAVIGETRSVTPYVDGLRLQGVPATVADGPRMTLAGLSAAYRGLRNTS